MKKPNCPLETGLRPCMCRLPRCPVCGYTKHDAMYEGDHGLCKGKIPERFGDKVPRQQLEGAK